MGDRPWEGGGMEIVWTVLGAIAVVVAIASNVTNVRNYLEARRERRAARGSDRDAVRDRSVAMGPCSAGSASEARAPAAAPPAVAGSEAASAPVPAAVADRHADRPVPAALRPPGQVGLLPLDMAPRPSIRTPDQRVRVFVSSTLAELADERAAVRAAIQALRLTPVMFEAGAWAHPPRDLYRAYLDQSDVFVGIYAARYGWVAPGEEVSGLEDEYLRSGERPKLIYVRRVEGEREPRLEGLLARIGDDDRVSYRPFRDAAELRDLVADDLATLLSERFDRALSELGHHEPAPVPVVWGPLFGRQREVERACTLLADPQVRLVTLVGPGGIGKSRLALEVAHRLQSASGDGVVFVGLQSVQRAELVAGAIADALGVRGVADRDATALLVAYLAQRCLTLVLDNLEQVVEAAPLLSCLLEVAPDAAAVGAGRDVVDLVADLVDHSLVQRLSPAGGTRYVSFELVRAAAELLAASGEAEAVRASNAVYFERFAHEHGRALHDGRPQCLPLLRA